MRPRPWVMVVAGLGVLPPRVILPGTSQMVVDKAFSESFLVQGKFTVLFNGETLKVRQHNAGYIQIFIKQD